MKTCKDCLKTKSLSDFNQYNPRTLKDGSIKFYYRPYCKSCNSARGDIFKKQKYIDDQAYQDAKREKNRKRLYDDRRNPSKCYRFIIYDAKKMDKIKGFENNLTKEFVIDLIKNPCRYCGETNIRMTLDRIDNTKGHTIDNVVESCIRCNLVRGNMPYNAWLIVAEGMKIARELGQFENWTKERS